MTQKHHTGGWCLLFLAAVIPRVHLVRNDSSEAQIYRPVLQPSETVPLIGTYVLNGFAGKPCIKATVGVEYIVIEKKKTWYFNLQPSTVRTNGSCGGETAVLNLTLPDNAASLQLTFRKEKNIFYITKLKAHVSPRPVCQGCANKTYSGVLDHGKLFTTAEGQSFKCQSENLLSMSPELRIKLVPLQMQAFTLPNGHYGEEEECWADVNKRVFPIIIGASVVGVILMAGLTSLFIRDRRRQGYDRL